MSGKKRIRDAFRNAVFKRDGYKCVMCGRKAVDAHHVVDRSLLAWGGYVVENGISLCADCHVKAEMFHATGTAHPGYSPDDLFNKIDSSLDLATKESEKLNLEFKLRKR